MATIQVRDVPEDVAAVIAEKAADANQSVSAYLRDLLAADAAAERRVRAMQGWHGDLQRRQAALGLPHEDIGGGASYVRAVREERERELAGRTTQRLDDT
jgi:plasmid stability protein